MLPLTLLLAFLPGASPNTFTPELEAIRAVGKEGTGNEAAAKAWASLVVAGEPALIPTLRAFDGASPAAQNWLRTAVGAIAENAKGKLNAADLTAFVCETKRHPSSRRVAFELLQAQAPTEAENILVSFTNDPSLELRRDAIAKNLEHLKDVVSLQKLFTATRDKDQVEAIAKLLKEKGVEPNVTGHFGYITQWHVAGPFDNTEEKGYAVAYDPEKKIDLTEEGWKPAQSSATYGTIDLNAALGKHKNAVGYAAATILAESDTTAEIRVASQNAVKFFVNGAEVFAREEYHHGTKMDQHTAPIKLKKGENTILLKVCQNDMPYAWAQAWGFAARLCDATGGALPVKQSFNGETIVLGRLAPAPKTEEKK